MTSATLDIAIFSFNRGAYLENCVASLQRNLPGVPFTVYDDGSDDPETVQYLSSLGERVRHMKSGLDDRHGGYYNNMQAALAATQADFLLMLQDDLQIVRPFDTRDLSLTQLVFEQCPDVAFISPLFMKGSKRAYFEARYRMDSSLRCYRWSAEHPEASGVPQKYADIALLHVARLRRCGWVFAASEQANGALARSHFADMVQMADPFVFYVPEEPAYRGRVLTLGAKLAARMAGNRVKSFIEMTPAQSRAFGQRPLQAYPFAEDFVNTHDPRVKKPYKFNVYRTRWVPLILNKLELLWRRYVSR